MKRFMLFFLLLCATTPALSMTTLRKRKPPVTEKLTIKKKEDKKEEPDSASLIVGTLLHSVIPNLLNAVAAKEVDDTEEILHSVGDAVQGTGALILALTKVRKRYPNLTPEICLLAYLQSEQGKLFLNKHRSLL